MIGNKHSDWFPESGPNFAIWTEPFMKHSTKENCFLLNKNTFPMSG